MPQSMGEIAYETQSKYNERYVPKKKEKKWTLGNLFRRKKTKESDSESSDSDTQEDGKKRGFLARRRRRRTTNRGSKDVSQSFEHVVLRPGGGNISSDGSRKSLKARVEANRDSMLKDSSSEEERTPRPRAPRSKRSSRDMTDCHMKVMELDSSPRSPRWTAKVVYCESSDYEARYTAHTRSATPSPAQSPIAKVKHLKRPPIPQPQSSRSLNCQKSASFDPLPKHTLQQFHNPQLRIPPPPPPRDPQRKIIPPLGYQQHDRPLSYAFENNQPVAKVMTDHNSNITAYKVNSSCSLDHQPVYKINSDNSLGHQPVYKINSNGSLDHHPVYKMNSNGYLDHPPSYRINPNYSLDQPVSKVNGTGSLDNRKTYQYYTDQQPRSRRPIHIARVDQPYLSDSQVGRVRMNDWRLPRDSNSSLCDSSDSREGGMDCRPLSMVMEASEQSPPQQRPRVITEEVQEKRDYQKRKSGNLEDALNELEAIYKSLQLRDEEASSSHRGFESDSGCNYRVVDDMAYRRLNRRDSGGSPDCRRVMSQAGSYLLVSPTLSPPPFAIAPPVPLPQNEPDITLDDVVYRNIRHTNNTLKINDPQPPFGIPVGPIAPAPSSDYLHATPKQLFRPTFKPRKTPDIVKDDLAYRNLRKDGQQDSLLCTEDGSFLSSPDNHPQSILKKKRAVRSLSANLLSIIQKEQFNTENQGPVDYMDFDRENHFEKTQSFSDLPDILNSRYKRNYSIEDVDITPRASRLYSDLPFSTTSTETLTDSRANVMNLQESSSCTKRYSVPQRSSPSCTTNISLPKTSSDYTKHRLPNSQQIISSPKRNLLNLGNSSSSDIEASKQFKTNGSIGSFSYNNSSSNYYMNDSSPSRSVNNHLQSPTRNGSKSPSSQYCDTFDKVESFNKDKQFENYVSDLDYLRHSLSRDRNDGKINSPNSFETHHDPLNSKKSNNKILNSEKCFAVGSDKLNLDKKQSTSSSPNRENLTATSPIVSTSPKITKDSNSVKPSRNELNGVQSSKLNALKNDDDIGDKNLLTHISPKIRVTSSKTVPKNENTVSCSKTPNRISIEGIKINVTPENKSVPLKQANNYVNNTGGKIQKHSIVVSKPTVPNPKVTVTHHEKSHQKNDLKASRQNSLEQLVSANGTGKKDKSLSPRPRSTINVGESTSQVDKNKNASPSSLRLSSTPEKESVKQRLPSPRLLNTDDKNKQKSPSPRLSVKSSSTESLKQKSQLSATSEKPSNTNMSEKTASTNKCNEFKRRTNRKSLSLNSGLSVEESCIKELTEFKRLSGTFNSKNANDFSSLIGNKNETHKGFDVHAKMPSVLSEDFSLQSTENKNTLVRKSSDDISVRDNSRNNNKNVSNCSNSKLEKNLHELLTEINLKQGEILAGGSNLVNKPSSATDTPSGGCTNIDKINNPNSNNTSDSCSTTLGKIISHKPVKLSTFSINEDDNIVENSETVVLSDNINKGNEIIGTSESMTDLLRELTRSLDQDFGCLTADSAQEGSDDNLLEPPNTVHRRNSDSKIFDVQENVVHTAHEEEAVKFPDDRNETKDTDDDELITDEADHEVMEINRKVLSELEQNKRKYENPSSGFEVKGVDAKKSINIQPIESDENLQPNDVTESQAAKSNGYNSDDSNAEFVEAICKTASEISSISNAASTATTSSTNVLASTSHHGNATNVVSLTSPDSRRWNRQSTSCDLDQNEGESS